MDGTTELKVQAEETKQGDEQKPCVRYIAVLGKIGVGKATIVNRIVGCEEEPFVVSSAIAPLSRPRDAQERRGKGNVVYSIKIVDTVGWSNDGEYAGDNNMSRYVTDLSKYYGNNPQINLVLFVMKCGRLSREEKDVFEDLVKRLPWLSKISALVITGCEGKSKTARQDIVENFRSDPLTASIANFMGQDIYTVGFPDISTLQESFRQIYQEDIKEDEETLREMVMKQDKLFNFGILVLPAGSFQNDLKQQMSEAQKPTTTTGLSVAELADHVHAQAKKLVQGIQEAQPELPSLAAQHVEDTKRLAEELKKQPVTDRQLATQVNRESRCPLL